MSENVPEAAESEAPGIVAPPRHPRVPQLIHLELAKMDRRRELAEIEAECEAVAEPIAVEIKLLEGEQEKILAGGRASADRRAEIGRLEQARLDLVVSLAKERAAQDARIQAEADRLAAELAEIDTSDAQRTGGLKDLNASLAAARERFDAARTTSRGRHLERSIAKIEKQQETIVTRNPGAKFFRIEMAISAEAERNGLGAKVRAVADSIRDPKFGQGLGDAIRAFRTGSRAEPSEFEVRMMALEIIHGMDVPSEDVELRVVYRPPNVAIQAEGITDAARARCLASLMERQKAPALAEGDAEATAA